MWMGDWAGVRRLSYLDGILQSVQVITPPLALTPFIRDYAFFDHKIDHWTPHYIWALPAVREHTLQLFPDDLPTLFRKNPPQDFDTGRCNLLGQLDHSCLDTHMPARSTRIQVSFQPAGLHRLTGLPAHVFTNRATNAELIWGQSIRRLVDQVTDPVTTTQRVHWLNGFFLDLLRRHEKRSGPADVDRLALQMQHSSDPVSIRALANSCHKGERQLERLFRERVGLSPKKFHRISRFMQANRLRQLSPRRSWLSIALEAGYYDLQHLSRDFKLLGRATVTGFQGFEHTEGQLLLRQR